MQFQRSVAERGGFETEFSLYSLIFFYILLYRNKFWLSIGNLFCALKQERFSSLSVLESGGTSVAHALTVWKTSCKIIMLMKIFLFSLALFCHEKDGLDQAVFFINWN